MTIITNSGLQESINSDNSGVELNLVEFVFGVWSWEPDQTATGLIAPFLTLPIRSVEVIGQLTQRLQTIISDVRLDSHTFSSDEISLNSLAASSKISGLIISDINGNPYQIGDDYLSDLVAGTVTRDPTGAIAAGETVQISFNVYGQTVDPYFVEFSPDTLPLDFPLVQFLDVRVFDLSENEYTLTTDFTFDQRTGIIIRESSGSIPADATVLVSYNLQFPLGEIGILTDNGTLFSIFSSPEPIAFKVPSISSLPVAYRFSLDNVPGDIVINTDDPITLSSLDAEKLQGVDVAPLEPDPFDVLQYVNGQWEPVAIVGDISAANLGDVLVFDGTIFSPETLQSYDNLDDFDTLLGDLSGKAGDILRVDSLESGLVFSSPWLNERGGWALAEDFKVCSGTVYKNTGLVSVRSAANILPIVDDGSDPRLSDVNCTDRFSANQGAYSPSTQFWKALSPRYGERDVWRSTKAASGFGLSDAVFYQYNDVAGKSADRIMISSGFTGQGVGQPKTFRIEDVDGASVTTIETFTDVSNNEGAPLILSFSPHTFVGNFRLWIADQYVQSGQLRESTVELSRLELFDSSQSGLSQSYALSNDKLRSEVLAGFHVSDGVAYCMVGHSSSGDLNDSLTTIDLDSRAATETPIEFFPTPTVPRYPVEILRDEIITISEEGVFLQQITQTFNPAPVSVSGGYVAFAVHDRIVIYESGDEFGYVSTESVGEIATLLIDSDSGKIWVSGRGRSASVTFSPPSIPPTSVEVVIEDSAWSRDSLLSGATLISEGFTGGMILWTQQGNTTVVAYDRGVSSSQAVTFDLAVGAAGPITSDGNTFVWVATTDGTIERWEISPFSATFLNSTPTDGDIVSLAYNSNVVAVGISYPNSVILLDSITLSVESVISLSFSPSYLTWDSDGSLWGASEDGGICKIIKT